MNILNKKRLSIVSLVIGVTLCGYTYLWFHAAEKLEDALLASLNRLEQQGYIATYDQIKIKGFPFKLEAHLFNPCIQCTDPTAFEITGAGLLTATTRIWNPRQITINVNEKMLISYMSDEPGQEPFASIEQFQIQGELGHPLSHNFSIMLKGVSTPIWKAHEISLASLNKDRANNTNEVHFALSKLTFTTVPYELPLPKTIDQIALSASFMRPVTFEGNLETVLKAWADQEGVIDLKSFKIAWGDIHLNGDGSLSLDQDLQPLAALSVKIDSVDPLLNVMVKKHMIKKSLLPIIKTALSFLKEGPENKSDIVYTIPVSFQNRELSLVGIPIITVDPILWNEIDF